MAFSCKGKIMNWSLLLVRPWLVAIVACCLPLCVGASAGCDSCQCPSCSNMWRAPRTSWQQVQESDSSFSWIPRISQYVGNQDGIYDDDPLHPNDKMYFLKPLSLTRSLSRRLPPSDCVLMVGLATPNAVSNNEAA